jgi:hypothetical protein
MRAFFENPSMYPDKFGATLALTGAYKMALKVFVNMDKLAAENFSKKGNRVKIGSFAWNSADPYDPSFVTNDRHAVQAALGLRSPDNLIPDMSNQKVYDLFTKAFTNIADKHGLIPNEAQALVWFAWRHEMLRDPGLVNPTTFFKPGNISDLFKVPQKQRGQRIYDAVQSSPGLTSDFKKEITPEYLGL